MKKWHPELLRSKGNSQDASQMELTVLCSMALAAMKEYFGTDRESVIHAHHVCGIARSIAYDTQLDPYRMAVLECAAALHDIGVKESLRIYDTAKGKYHEECSAEVTRQMLESLPFPREMREEIVALVRGHHSYRPDGGIVHQILFEAETIAEEGQRSDHPDRLSTDALETMFRTRSGRDQLRCTLGVIPGPPLPLVADISR